MSSITLTQTAEKPITVTTDEMISSFAEIRHGRRAVIPRHPKGIVRSRYQWMRPKSLRSV
ncbi:hypothetical protein GCM10007858_21370 [Bradyrhizobium liaoningense]|nr:hypothetical protein GCM10007858_21370 [Bradyrhizobium liaoningense]